VSFPPPELMERSAKIEPNKAEKEFFSLKQRHHAFPRTEKRGVFLRDFKLKR